VSLPYFAEIINVHLSEAEQGDIEDLVIWIKGRDDINKTTKNDYKVLLKCFIKFAGGGEYPESQKWIKISNKIKSKKVPEKLLTEDNVMELIANCLNKRDKALISILWETEARIGEIMGLKVGSTEDRVNGLKVVVDGKTGKRRLPLIESVPYILEWIQNHYPREDKEAPLWINIGPTNTGKPMSYASINKMLRDVRDRTSIDKPINPHHFRHSRATFLANKITEAQFEGIFWMDTGI